LLAEQFIGIKIIRENAAGPLGQERRRAGAAVRARINNLRHRERLGRFDSNRNGIAADCDVLFRGRVEVRKRYWWNLSHFVVFGADALRKLLRVALDDARQRIGWNLEIARELRQGG